MKSLITLFLALFVVTNVYAQRSLKMRVTTGKIQSRSFPVPDGGVFDFGYAVNSQLMTAIAMDDNFLSSRGTQTDEVSQKSLEAFVMSDGISANLAATKSDLVPACITNKSLVKIAGQVISFEVKSGFGITLGYNKDGSHGTVGLDASIKMKTAELHINLQALETYNARTPFELAASKGSSKQKIKDISANINFKEFAIGPQYYMQTPLADVTLKATRRALASLSDNIKKNQPWESTVLAVGDPSIMVNAGYHDGLKVGDKLKIYNMNHSWAGKPCQSQYYGHPMSSSEPDAVVEVKWVGPFTAGTLPIRGMHRNEIKVADTVLIEQLIED